MLFAMLSIIPVKHDQIPKNVPQGLIVFFFFCEHPILHTQKLNFVAENVITKSQAGHFLDVSYLKKNCLAKQYNVLLVKNVGFFFAAHLYSQRTGFCLIKPVQNMSFYENV